MKKSTSIIAVTLFIVGMLSVSINFSADSQDSTFLADTAVSSAGQGSFKFFSCNGAPKDPSWTYYPKYNTIHCFGNKNTYLAYGEHGYASSPALKVAPHRALTVSFKMAFIDSWDGETFTVTADGASIHSVSYAHGSSPSNTCQNGWADNYATVSVNFNHTDPTVTLKFSSTLNQAVDDEAWGICDLVITASKDPLLANGTPVKVETVSEKSVVAFGCSSMAKNWLWDYNQGFNTIYCSGNRNTYLAYGQGGKVTSPAYPVAPHKALIVSFKLAFIDSWDGETFTVTADGTPIHSASHTYGSSPSNTCQNGWNDHYATVTVGFSHTASSVTFAISSTLNQEVADEAWGVCDFTITSSQDPVLSNGARIPLIDASPRTWFAGSSMVKDDTWTYNQGFSTISCAGNTYLGHYGKGASVTSPAFKINTEHKGIVVSFKLALIDSWDRESFYVKADGSNNAVYTKTHRNGDVAATNTCVRMDAGWNDVYLPVTFGFNHTANTLSLTFTSNLDEDKNNESWGISDLTITLTPTQVAASGRPIVTLGDKSISFFPCTGPVADEQWTYNQGFSTVKCVGKTYLGHYAKGAAVDSFAFATTEHQAIVVSFRLALIDSWLNESFFVKADGRVVYQKLFTFNQQTGTNTCVHMGQGWNDDYMDVTFGFNHTASTVSFTLTSDLDEAKDNESWGVCDFTITLAPMQVAASGRPIVTLGEKPTSFFPCTGPFADEQWTYNQGFSTVKCVGKNYLGHYGKGAAVDSYAFATTEHQGIVVSFKLALIDSWLNESFFVKADGRVVYTKFFTFNQQTGTNTCVHMGQGWNDDYMDVTFGFNHTASTVSFTLTSDLEEAKDNESWGVCDFTITLTPTQVAASGRPIITLSEKPTTFFPCTGPVADEQWTYNHGFSTVKCVGKTYLGHYGMGANVDSVTFATTEHKAIAVSFKLALIDSWLNESFYVKVDGRVVYQKLFSFNEKTGTNTCVRMDAGWNDDYMDVTFGFNHTASTINFTLTSDLDEDKNNESWGVCDLNITTSKVPLTSEGTPYVAPVQKAAPGPIKFEGMTVTGNDLMKWHNGQDPSGIIGSFVSSGYECVITKAEFNGTSTTNGIINLTIKMKGYTATSVDPVWEEGIVVELIIKDGSLANQKFLSTTEIDQAEIKYFTSGWANNVAIPKLKSSTA